MNLLLNKSLDATLCYTAPLFDSYDIHFANLYNKVVDF